MKTTAQTVLLKSRPLGRHTFWHTCIKRVMVAGSLGLFTAACVPSETGTSDVAASNAYVAKLNSPNVNKATVATELSLNGTNCDRFVIGLAQKTSSGTVNSGRLVSGDGITLRGVSILRGQKFTPSRGYPSFAEIAPGRHFVNYASCSIGTQVAAQFPSQGSEIARAAKILSNQGGVENKTSITPYFIDVRKGEVLIVGNIEMVASNGLLGIGGSVSFRPKSMNAQQMEVIRSSIPAETVSNIRFATWKKQ